MAVHLATSSDYVKRLTNIVQPSSAYTAILWFKSNSISTSPNYQTPFALIDDPAIYNYFAGIFLNNVNSDLNIGNGVTFPVVDFSTIPTVSTYYPVAYVRSGNTHSLYVSGILIGSLTLNISAGTFGFEALGNDTFSDGNIDIWNFREWNIALSSAQINAEINSPTAVVHTSNLVTFTPLTSDLLDVSGNGNDWTQVGSVSFVADPTFPSHSTFGTAQVISSLPYSDTDSSLVVGGFCFDKWYKITTVNAVDNWSIFPFGDLSVYEPEVNVFNSLQQQLMSNLSPNVPINFPSYPDATDYYFQVTPSNKAISSGSLVFNVERFIQQAIPVGSVAIPNDGQYDFGGPNGPLCYVNPSVSQEAGVLAYFNNFPVGEYAVAMLDGTVMMSTDDTTDGLENQVIIFDSNLNVLHTITYGISNSHPFGMATNGTDFWFSFNDGSDRVLQVHKNGTLGTNYVISGVFRIAVSPDGSTLYYTKNGNTTIHTWNLNTNSAGSDFVAGSAHSQLGDLLCLSDGSVVIGDATSNNIKRYNSSAVLQWTITPPITLTGGNTPDRLCPNLDATSFVAYLNHEVGTHPVNVVIFKSSDGSVISNTPYTLFSNSDGGVSRQTASATPVRFGPSGSCPIWVVPVSPSQSYIVVGKASDPLASGVNFTITGPAGSFVLQTDTAGETIAVAPGTYSIVESPQANYQPNYFVSNDPVNNDNLHVAVAAGELVDVVIENQLSTTFGGLYQLVPGKTNDTLRNQDGSTTNKMISWFWELFTNRDK